MRRGGFVVYFHPPISVRSQISSPKPATTKWHALDVFFYSLSDGSHWKAAYLQEEMMASAFKLYAFSRSLSVQTIIVA